MKSLAFFFLMLGIVFITIGYTELKFKNKYKEKIIEYRFIPRSIYEEQMHPINLKSSFGSMFEKDEPQTSSTRGNIY